MVGTTPGAAGPLRVGIFGRFGSGNWGNDGTLEAMLGFLRSAVPEAELDCWCSGPQGVTEHFGLRASQMHWLHSAPPRRLSVATRAARIALGIGVDAVRTARWVARHDVVVLPGTGPLESTLQVRPWETPWALFVLGLSGRLLGTTVAFVSVGASPSRQAGTRWLTRSAARLAHYRSFRDESSRTAMAPRHGTRAADPIYPDLVFALPTPSGSGESAERADRVVGVGVLDYHGSNDDRHRADEIHAAYLEKIRAFIGWLLDEGYRVRLLAGDRDDEVVVRTILADLEGRTPALPPGTVVYERADSLTELMAQMNDVGTVVASRFHNVLCALKCERPTVSIGYGGKHTALMSEMGLGGYCQDLRELDLDRLREQFAEVRAERDRVRRLLARGNAVMRERLDEQFAVLSTQVLGVPAPTAVRTEVAAG